MKGSIAPNRPGHHGTVVARTVGTVAISCNVNFSGTRGNQGLTQAGVRESF